MDKTVYLKAYFRKNLGDDMFVRYIAEKYPDIRFRIYTTPAYAAVFKHQRNVRPIGGAFMFFDRALNKVCHKRVWNRFFEKRADATVHIGGSIFIEPKTFVTPPSFFYPDNMFYIGCNFGPYHSDNYRDFIRQRLQKATDVCFRDTYSYRQFEDVATVRTAPDVLFGYPLYPQKQQGQGIGISVIDMSSRPELREKTEVYYTAIAALIDRCADENIPVKLLAFCADEGDMKAVAEIKRRAKTKSVDVCVYDGDIDAFLSQFNSCEIIVATRFHAMVIGWVLGKKVFPVIYSSKQTNVMEDVRFTGAYWDLKNDDGYPSERLFADCTTAPILENVQQFVRSSKEQFAALDAFVARCR